MDEPLPNLLPQPRHYQKRAGICKSPSRVEFVLDSSLPKPQGFLLSIEADRCNIIAHDQAGAFYGRQTLDQLRLIFPDALPCLQIEDWPDFPVRGVMLDISRDKVPTMRTLFDLIDLLSEWKINQLQLYTEHTFAYAGHEEVWQHASPMTGSQIVELDTYCRERFIELVPNQNSFGHMERWLRLPRYRALAEAVDGADTPWGYRWKGPFSLCPTDPASIAFLSDLYGQLLPHFTSKLFNVGCDETFDIGKGRSRALAATKGSTQIYLDFLHQVHGLVTRHGRTMMFWGDIIIDQPDLIAQLPRPVIALEWGYEADHPFDKEGHLFARAGIPFYVCPGTSSWLSIAGRTDNMWANQLSAAENGLNHGAVGYLNTDWGDHGHLQYLPISYAGFAAGAALSWCVQSNRNIDLAAAINAHAFKDKSATLGKVALDLGNVYKAVGKQPKNSSALFRILIPSSTHLNPLDGITMENLSTAEAAIHHAIAPLSQSQADKLTIDEFAAAAAMLRHACRRGMWKLNPTSQSSTALAEEMRAVIAEHQRLWLARNRPGALSDSTQRLETNLAEYVRG